MTSLSYLLKPSPRSRRWRRSFYRVIILAFVILFTLDIFRIAFPGHDGHRETLSLSATSNRPSIFIASIHWNNEEIIRSHWSKALLDFISKYGAENVYVSILEGGSWDGTKGALRELDIQLRDAGVERNVELQDVSHEAMIKQGPGPEGSGWIQTSREKKEFRRIPYLAGLRNTVMEHMKEVGKREENPRRFDRVLWLNDVVFQTSDILALLATHNSSYAAACSLDFSKPPSYYDTFALRDSSGAKPITDTWPYFLSLQSRRALMANSPVPVQSCWNGMVVFDAEPFYENVVTGKESKEKSALAFRGVDDSLAQMHLEGSECCLVHVDNYLSAEKGVWLNPSVRVGYNGDAYAIVNPQGTHGPLDWPSPRDKFFGLWTNRAARVLGRPRRFLENTVVHWRLSGWQRQKNANGQKNTEEGSQCLVNEMQVLAENGWAHV